MDRGVDDDRARLTGRLPGRVVAVLAAPPAAFVALLFIWPVVTLLREVVDRGAFAAIDAGRVTSVLWYTTWQALLSTLATVLAGLAPAFLLARWQFPGRRIVAAVVAVPFLLPTVVVAAAFSVLLPDRLVGTTWAVIAAHVYFNVSVVVRVVGATWSQFPADLGAAARTLGAAPWRVLTEVTLPSIRPAVASAATIVFLFCFTSYGVVRLLGSSASPTLEVEIARRALGLGDVGGAAVLSLVQLVVLAVALGAASRLQRRSATRWGAVTTPRRRPTSGRTRVGVTLGAVGLVVFSAAPLAALALTSVRPAGDWSLRGWQALFDGGPAARPGSGVSVDAWGALSVSLRYAVQATVLSVVVGGLAALAIAAAGRRGRLLDAALLLPLAVSAVTVGFGMLITFDTAPFDWRGASWFPALGHALVATPFVIRSALPVLRARPVGWWEAAATLGAAPVRAWWEVDVRRLGRPLAVGAGFAAAVSLGEFGATSILSRSGQESVPVAIARLLGRAGDLPRAEAAALAVVLAAATMVIMVVVDLIGSRDAERS